MRSLLSLCVLAAGGVFASGAGAQAVVLDFEDVGCAQGRQQCEIGDQYVAKGFALRYTPSVDEPMAAGLVAVTGPGKPAGKTARKAAGGAGGGTGVSIRSCEAQVALMANDNAAFDVLSIDLAVLNGEGAASVEFIGQRDDGTEVRQTLVIETKAGWRRFRFQPEFKGISALRWSQGDCLNQLPHIVDNIALQRSDRP